MQNNAKGKMCPRNCGRRMMPNTMAGFNPNPKSPVDEKRVCTDCYMEELYERLS